MTTIEWTQRPGTKGESWNPIRARNKATGGLGHFCEHVSEGCRHCYAEAMQKRLFNNPIRYAAQDRDKVEIVLDEAKLAAPLRWRKPRTVFVCSMTDLFGAWVEDDWLDRIFAVMALTPQHTYQVLTKRPERMRAYLGSWPMDGAPDRITDLATDIAHGFKRGYQGSGGLAERPLPNVWLGVSVEHQDSFDARVEQLAATPAALRFVSYEPALGPIDCGNAFDDPPDNSPYGKIDWVIAGGESGPNARSADPEWFRRVRDECNWAGVPCMGKKAAGRLLDGREHSAWPA